MQIAAKYALAFPGADAGGSGNILYGYGFTKICVDVFQHLLDAGFRNGGHGPGRQKPALILDKKEDFR